jgi:hypothetical protein
MISLRRLTAAILVLSIATATQAEVIGSLTASERDRIAAFLDRADVGAELARQGVSVHDAKARAAALSADEAADLAGQVDRLPAGGDGNPFAMIGAVVFLIVAIPVLLVAGAIKLVTALNHAAANSPDRSAAQASAK